MPPAPRLALDAGPVSATVSPETVGGVFFRRLKDSALTRPRVAVSISAVGIVLLVLVGASAPNNHTLRAPLPLPLLAPMPGGVSTVAVYVSIALCCLGLVGLLGANSRGWRPRPGRLFGIGAVTVAVVANLTPVGSSDTASYAAYGRIAALGGDPYVTTPGQLGGAYAHLVSDVWLRTPSVYGPVATWLQAAAAQVGGHRPWLTIWLLMLVNGAAFLATGYFLIRTSDDPVRAGLMWVANPVLIVLLVAGGHLDTLIAALAVCAVHCARRAARPRDDLLVGLLVGLACGIKISAVLLGLGLLWPLLRERAWGRITRQISAFGLVSLVGYLWYGLHALTPLSAASHLVSVPSLWAAFQQLGRAVVGPAVTSAAISVGWPVLMLALAWLIHRRIPPKAPLAVSGSFALGFAWILMAPWSMPWYTAPVWAMAALLPRSPLIRWLILTTSVLAFSHNSGGHGWTW
ncbi:glycosyltransferase 87 family protein [Streptomyces sp. NPDC054933]